MALSWPTSVLLFSLTFCQVPSMVFPKFSADTRPSLNFILVVMFLNSPESLSIDPVVASAEVRCLLKPSVMRAVDLLNCSAIFLSAAVILFIDSSAAGIWLTSGMNSITTVSTMWEIIEVVLLSNSFLNLLYGLFQVRKEFQKAHV